MTTLARHNALNFKRLRPNAIIPQTMSAGAACFDLAAAWDNNLPRLIAPGTSIEIPTGLACEFNPGFAMFVRSRSGLAFKHKVYAFHGTINSDYRGELLVQLTNHGPDLFSVKSGDRIAQAMLVPTIHAVITEVSELGSTQRDTSGLGSTGV